jgi:hypothetical protein
MSEFQTCKHCNGTGITRQFRLEREHYGVKGHMGEKKCYRQMKSRCLDPSHVLYPQYGGRGIKVGFTDFQHFLKVLGPRPERMMLHRKDVNGDYVEGNVKWGTWMESNGNKRKRGSRSEALRMINKLRKEERDQRREGRRYLTSMILKFYDQNPRAKQVDAAIRFGCSQSQVSRTLRLAGRGPGKNSYHHIDHEEIMRLVKTGMLYSLIAAQLHCDRAHIADVARAHGVHVGRGTVEHKRRATLGQRARWEKRKAALASGE